MVVWDFWGVSKYILEMVYLHVYSFSLSGSFQFSSWGALPFTHLIYCLQRYSWLSIFYWVSYFINLTLNAFSIWHALINFLSFFALVLVGFILLRRNAVFTLSRLLLTARFSHETLFLALGSIVMHCAAVFMWELTKFSYSSFGVSISDITWRVSNLFLTAIVYLLLISLLVSKDQSLSVV